MASSTAHPSVILFCWLAIVIALQALTLAPLLALLLLAVPLASIGMRRRWRHLARRSRLLIVVLWLTFFFSTPGEALVVGQPGSYEGLLAACEHAARFLAILAAVAWLLDTLSIAGLMAGLHGLLSPAARLGLASERAVVRLALVLQYVEGGRLPVWSALIDAAPEAADVTGIEIEALPLTRRDRSLAVGGAILLLLAICA